MQTGLSMKDNIETTILMDKELIFGNSQTRKMEKYKRNILESGKKVNFMDKDKNGFQTRLFTKEHG